MLISQEFNSGVLCLIVLRVSVAFFRVLRALALALSVEEVNVCWTLSSVLAILTDGERTVPFSAQETATLPLLLAVDEETVTLPLVLAFVTLALEEINVKQFVLEDLKILAMVLAPATSRESANVMPTETLALHAPTAPKDMLVLPVRLNVSLATQIMENVTVDSVDLVVATVLKDMKECCVKEKPTLLLLGGLSLVLS